MVIWQALAWLVFKLPRQSFMLFLCGPVLYVLSDPSHHVGIFYGPLTLHGHEGY